MSAKPSAHSTIPSSHGARSLNSSEDVRTEAGTTGGVAVDTDASNKDARAREHARQRTKTKERREQALARERKEKAAAVRVLGLKGTSSAHAHGNGHGHGGSSGGANASKAVRRLSMESWDGELPREGEGEGQEAVSPVRADMDHGEEAGEDVDVGASVRASGHTELTLRDVLSKPCRPKTKQLDFEMIPPIRSVIALDDADVDEPWEYITRASVHDGSAAWKGKSYAQAVANAM